MGKVGETRLLRTGEHKGQHMFRIPSGGQTNRPWMHNNGLATAEPLDANPR
jgi:hypothetical protein